MKQPVKKLMNRNFFLLWQGQSVSQIGSQIFDIALVLWIKEATGSATLMGLFLMASSLPTVILGPISGTVADRYSRRKIIVISDFINGLTILTLAALLFLIPAATDTIIVWLFIVAIIGAIADSFFSPAISASVPDLVPEHKIDNANSLIQMSFSLAVFIGQGIGGTLFRLIGAPLLFIFNGLTYLFSAFSELFIHIPQKFPEKSQRWQDQFQEFKHDIVEGFHYIWHRPGLRELVLVSVITSFFTAPIIILLPFYVEDFLQVSVDWYGFLLAGYSIGTVMGFLIAGTINLRGNRQSWFIISFLILEAAGFGMLGLIRLPWPAMGLAFLGGAVSGFTTVKITTILQMTTPSEIRGRVFGLLGTIVGALTPIAMGLTGIIADLIGQNIPLIYIVSGATMAASVIIISFNSRFRQLLAYTESDQTKSPDKPTLTMTEKIGPEAQEPT